MFQTLQVWLNEKGDYYTGVAIYSQLSHDANLLTILRKGPNEFREKRLKEILLEAYENLKGAAPTKSATKTPAKKITKLHVEQPPVNPELYNACKIEADHKYKKVMNDRAILFKMAQVENFQDPNTIERIEARTKLAIDVVQEWKTVSELYDRANYVKLHGRLPDNGEEEENEYDHLPDHLVKLRLDNARKAYNKLKKKESTPERVALMQGHEETIKKLEKKWHSLKP